MEFLDKVVVITGAAGGIGTETARLFAKEGAKLVLVDMNHEALTALVENLELQNGKYLTVVADVTDEQQVKSYVQQTVDTFGKIDVFFNNAGTEGKSCPIYEQTVENFVRVMNVNVVGVFLGLKHVISAMIPQKSGSIINTASTAGIVGTYGMSPYNASKHAVMGLTKASALECGQLGIRVNAICPGPINTRMMREAESALDEDPQVGRKLFTESIPMKRYGEPQEVAQLVAFLASDRATYITGSTYTIDGGKTPM